MEQQGEIVLYQPETTFKLEVRLENETVWLTQAQIAELFGTGRQAITKHLKNIFNSNELEENSVCSILELTAADGKTYKTKIYNLDAILSVGYRVNSKNATSFRCWANKILKEYLLRGYSINKRLNNIEQRINNDLPKHEQRIGQIEEKIDLIKKLDGMVLNVQFITEKSPIIVEEYKEKITTRIHELLEETQIDEARIAQEVTMFADKVCVDEELVRLDSHIKAMKEALINGGTIGRRLDFIAQEMNREANTTLSKTSDQEISDKAIELKTDIEKVREQIQNIE